MKSSNSFTNTAHFLVLYVLASMEIWLCSGHHERYADTPFESVIVLDGGTVSCSKRETSKYPQYAGRTWTCTDVKVNGSRIAFGLLKNKKYKSNMNCGDDTKSSKAVRNNDLIALCKEMLEVQGAPKDDLWAVFADDISCKRSNGTRIIVQKNETTGFISFNPYEEGVGYLQTLQCMLRDSYNHQNEL